MCASLCTLFDGTTSVAVCCPANEFSGARFHSIQLLRAFCGRVAASADSSSLICRVLRSLGKYTFSTLIPSRSRSLVFKGRRLLAVSRAQPKQGEPDQHSYPCSTDNFHYDFYCRLGLFYMENSIAEGDHHGGLQWKRSVDRHLHYLKSARTSAICLYSSRQSNEQE